jgi:hypothetical protein
LIDDRRRTEKQKKTQESTMTRLETERTTRQNGKVMYTAKTRTTGGYSTRYVALLVLAVVVLLTIVEFGPAVLGGIFPGHR